MIKNAICIQVCLFFLATALSTVHSGASGQSIEESIVSVETRENLIQQGVLSLQGKHTKPEKLLVVISGHPGITRPYKDPAGKIQTRQNGNFLVRSRSHFISDKVSLLLLDCRSDFVDICPDAYQASSERSQDVLKLVDAVKKNFPSIREVWAVSTSRGAITTAGFIKHASDRFAGVIHTAATFSKVYDQKLDFGPSQTSQFFIHHRDDPCSMTLFQDAQDASRRWHIPLVSVTGGGGFHGNKCQAFTQHGFKGKEAEVGQAILFIVENGKPKSLQID